MRANSMEVLTIAAVLFGLGGGCIGIPYEPEAGEGCQTNDDCDAGRACVAGECRTLCNVAQDCGSGEVCYGSVCTLVTAGDAPQILEVSGNGSAPDHFQDRLVIGGQHLGGAEFRLEGDPMWRLDVEAGTTDTRATLILPDDLVAGTYVLTATSLAGADQAEVSLLAEPKTAEELRALLLTVDGDGSGLDADLLDGSEVTAFAAASHAHADYLTSSDLTDYATSADLASHTFSWNDLTGKPERSLVFPAGSHCLYTRTMTGTTYVPAYSLSHGFVCAPGLADTYTVTFFLALPDPVTVSAWGISYIVEAAAYVDQWQCTLMHGDANGCPSGSQADCEITLPTGSVSDVMTASQESVAIPVDNSASPHLGWVVQCTNPTTSVQQLSFRDVYVRYTDN